MAVLVNYGDDWRFGYVDLTRRLANRPENIVNGRGGVTYEISDFVFTLGPDAIDLPLGVGRKPSQRLAAAEAIQLCAGVGMPELTEAVSSQVASYVRDANGVVHGNYGKRVDLQIVDAVEKLRAEPKSRQAIIQIWDKNLDSEHRTPMPRDIPCTVAIGFLVRGGRLDMSVIMRSNDAWLGTPYDVFQFRQLQRTVARQLGRDPGVYTHHAISMHVYDKDLAKIRALAVDRAWTAPDYFPDGLYAPRASSLPSALVDCLAGDPTAMNASHRWYYDRLSDAYAKVRAAR